MVADTVRIKNPILSCDNCRRRKVRCDRSKPCAQCVEVSLLCTHQDKPRRKGPKGKSAPVLSSLLAQNGVRSARRTGSNTTCGENSPQTNNGSLSFLPNWSINCSESGPRSISTNASDSIVVEVVNPQLPTKRPVSSAELLAHVSVFVKYLYPIMPVFHIENVRLDCGRPETVSPRRYSFLVALCAATHIQLKLDTNESIEVADTNHLGESGKGMLLLAEAVKSLGAFDVMEMPDIDSVLTSFFLFAAFGNLNKQVQAWHYLSQSISFAFTLKLHFENSYAGLEAREVELRRTVFWLLFITERAYCLQQKKPIMLRNPIRKPAVFASENPALTFGFVMLSSLFENLPPEFYDHIIHDIHDPNSMCLIYQMYQSLALPIPLLHEVSETQQTDITITQNWLQAILWKTSMTVGAEALLYSSFPPLSSSRLRHDPTFNYHSGLLPLHTPVLAGKAIMGFLSGVSQKFVDSHGIGMEQKLFDVGNCIVHLAQNASPQAARQIGLFVVDMKELLWAVLAKLYHIRHCKSYLFPVLLTQSKGILGLENIPRSIHTDVVVDLDPSRPMDTSLPEVGKIMETLELGNAEDVCDFANVQPF